jgi:long-chain fatty acid transport protein
MASLRAKFGCLFVLLLSCGPAWADGVVRDGLGPISTGRGGTNLGFSDNGAVIHDNAAGMVNISGDGLFDIAADTVLTDVHYQNTYNNVYSAVKPFPLPMLGVIKKFDDGDLALGFGVFAPAGFGARYDMQNPITGPVPYQSFGALAKFLPSIAYRITDRLSIGGTFGVGVSIINFQGAYTVQTGPLAGVPTTIDFHSAGAAPTGSIGLQYLLSEDTTLGFNWTTPTSVNLSGTASLSAYGLAPSPIGSNFTSTAHVTWPQSFAWGFKHQLAERHRVSADLYWYLWSSAFNQFNFALANSSNPLVPILAGPTVRDALPLNWTNTCSLRLGYEFLQDDRNIWRAGCVYHSSPSPSSTLNPYTDGVLEYAVSAGYSHKFRRASFNAAYQYSWGHARYVQQSSIIGGDFSNSSLSASCHWISMGFTVPF